MAATGDADGDGQAYVDHDLLAPEFIERRRYQLELAATAREDHTLVCLPTGLGKTTVSLLVTAERLQSAGGTSLFLAPTKPLVDQHAAFYREALEVPDDEIVVFTGEVRPDDRADLWDDARIVVATPQVVENDLIGNRISLSSVTHLTFDECHRATGSYSYVYIAERYHADAADPLVTGMSASPGGDAEAILTVCQNLGIAEVAVMTEDDADVAEYTYDTDVEWETIELPEEVLAIRDSLNEVITDRLERLKSLGVTSTTQPDLSQKELNRMRGKLQRLIDNDQSDGYKGMSVHAEVMKLRRAVELVETQSVEALRRYFERQRDAARSSGASKASQRLVADQRVRTAMERAESFDGLHPKFRRTRMLLAKTLGIRGGDRVIVFTESRDTAEALTDFLAEGFAVRRFVGQGDRDGSDGMTQTEQKDTLEAFRDGEFEVLVSTSVAEEGLDVPEVDLVLFFEPVPTAIRSIQRKGRTGRQTEGRVVVLMAEDTRDEAYFWISRRREREMEDELRSLKGMADEIESELRQEALDAYEDASERTAGTPSGDGDGASVGDGDRDRDGDGGAAVGGDATDREGRTAGGPTASDGAGTAEGDREAASVDPGGDRDDAPADGAGDSATVPATDAGSSTLADFAGGDDDPESAAEAGAPTESGRDGTADAADDEDGIGGDGDDETGIVATPDDGEAVEVVIDQRELNATIARELSKREGFETRLETLAVGDYVCSDRVAVERKSVADFLDTLTGGDRSLFEQVGDLSRNYARPVVIIEGEGLYERRNVAPAAIRGAVASLVVDFGVSVLRTTDEADTTELLATLARREQEERDRTVSVHSEKSGRTLAEQQEYVVSAIADVGPVTARSLLETFGTVEAVMTARRDDLTEVSGVGEVTADRMREVIGSEYPER
jgi:Fanconi anemia group M protein